MSWTDERVEILKKMWGEGQSASQIAKELGGVTRNAVIGKVHRLGLSNRATSNSSAKSEAKPKAAPRQRPRPQHQKRRPPKAAEPAAEKPSNVTHCVVKSFSGSAIAATAIGNEISQRHWRV